MLVIGILGDGSIGSLLILSQVILSLQLSFAVVPLVLFTGDRRKMGRFVNSRRLSITAWAMAGLIIILNGYLLVVTVAGWIVD